MSFKPRKRTNSYWEKRSIERFSQSEMLAKEYSADILNIYDKSRTKLTQEIKKIYETCYKNNQWDTQKLREIIPNGDINKLKREIKALGFDIELPKNYQFRVNRLEALNMQLVLEAKKIAEKENKIQTIAHNQTINNAYYQTAFDVSQGIGATPISFSVLPISTIDEMMTTKWHGGNYSDRIWGNSDKLAQALREELTVAIATGQSPEKTIRQFARQFNVAKYNAKRLILTETAYFENESEALSAEKMEIEKYILVAVLDNRTSAICQHMDGKIYKYKDRQKGVNFPPFHVLCRTTETPYLGKKYRPKTRISRNPITGKNEYIDNMNYQQWRESLEVKYGKTTIDNTLVKSYKSQHQEYKLYLGKNMPSYNKFVTMRFWGMNDREKVFWEDAKSYVRLGRSGNLPKKLDFKIYQNNIHNKNWQAVDFSPKLIDGHYEKHVLGKKKGKKPSFKGISKEQYINQAVELLNSKNSDDIDGFIDKKGEVWKYKKSTNEFAKARKNGIIKTYYKPTSSTYWDRKKKEYKINE